jgi:hypothetical protein
MEPEGSLPKLTSIPFWKTCEYQRDLIESNVKELKYEIIIIGAGMTGVSTAYWLKESQFPGMRR